MGGDPEDGRVPAGPRGLPASLPAEKKWQGLIPIITVTTIVIVGIAAAWDVRTGRIPNVITLPAICLGLALNMYDSGWPGLWAALAGTLVGLLTLAIPFALGGIGAGDVKLMAVVGALNGGPFAFKTFLLGAIAGGIMALAVIAWKGRLKRLVWGMALSALPGGPFGAFPRLGMRFPYGVAILTGTVSAYMLR